MSWIGRSGTPFSTRPDGLRPGRRKAGVHVLIHEIVYRHQFRLLGGRDDGVLAGWVRGVFQNVRPHLEPTEEAHRLRPLRALVRLVLVGDLLDGSHQMIEFLIRQLGKEESWARSIV